MHTLTEEQKAAHNAEIDRLDAEVEASKAKYTVIYGPDRGGDSFFPFKVIARSNLFCCANLPRSKKTFSNLC